MPLHDYLRSVIRGLRRQLNDAEAALISEAAARLTAEAALKLCHCCGLEYCECNEYNLDEEE